MLPGLSHAEALPSHPSQLLVSKISRQKSAMCVQAGFEQQLSAAETALESHSSQGPYFLGNFSYLDLMFMPSLVRAHHHQSRHMCYHKDDISLQG